MRTGKRNRSQLGIIGLVVIFTCLGCSSLRPKLAQWQASVTDTFNETFNLSDSESSVDARQKNSDRYFIHTSRWSWETLGVLADWYTGDSKNWEKLAAINPNVNPQKIASGSEIFIPVNLLKTRKALPQDYAGNYCRKCFRHSVRWSGESMSLIAKWYTGAFKNWRKLAQANPRLNPNRIKIGNVIVIPPALLKTKEPLPQKVAARYTAGYFAHTVKQDGQKMAVIVNWYTGKAANWKVIARANPELNPHHLVKGNEVYIPAKLLKTRQPIPNSQTAQTAETPKPKPASVEKKMPPVEEEEIKIFGPKQFPKS
jgi:hypothetical protein